ncbi:MAG TPA: HEAT repeat domain-containing protein [Terriglobia bacterium]|nr:HEAT repeat domain-containing protein [Terriglobia bacterium]
MVNRPKQKLVALSILLFFGMIVYGQERPVAPEPPWADLERELRQQGLKTDAESLVAITRSNVSEEKRWTAIEVLGLRNEQLAKGTLLEILRTGETQLLKETAALALARLGDQAGVLGLEKFMKASTDPERQVFMAARLAELGNRSGYQYVVQAVSGGVTHLRYISVGALVAFLPLTGDSRGSAAERLLALLDDRDAMVRKEVLVYLPLAILKGLPVTKVRPIVQKMARSDSDPAARELARLMLISWDEASRQKR